MDTSYSRPFDPEQLETEPTDTQANQIARGLAHWLLAYPDANSSRPQEILQEILQLNSASTDPMTRDECRRIEQLIESRRGV